jgi:peptidoglycan/LPS O-acetylase OafA/YrhL
MIVKYLLSENGVVFDSFVIRKELTTFMGGYLSISIFILLAGLILVGVYLRYKKKRESVSYARFEANRSL